MYYNDNYLTYFNNTLNESDTKIYFYNQLSGDTDRQI